MPWPAFVIGFVMGALCLAPFWAEDRVWEFFDRRRRDRQYGRNRIARLNAELEEYKRVIARLSRRLRSEG